MPAVALTLEMKSGPFSAAVEIPASSEDACVRADLTRTSGDAPKTFLEYEAIHDREGGR